MKPVPTADSLIFKSDKVHFSDSPSTMGTAIDIDSVKEIMIEFAKLHVKAAIEAATKTHRISPAHLSAILNSYPLSNIK